MRGTGFIVLAALAALAACDRAESDPAAAQTVAAVASAVPTCPEFPQNPDAEAQTRPVKVPPQLASFVKASDTTLTVQRTTGAPACIDIGGIDVESFDTFLDGRLIGAELFGFEYNSYLLVDRNTQAAPVETGVKPVFSPSGRRFASVDISEAGFGAFEALGVWEVTDNAIRNVFTTEEGLLDRGYDWSVVRWASEDCLVFSTAADTTGVDLNERNFHELRLTGRPELKDVAEGAACNG